MRHSSPHIAMVTLLDSLAHLSVGITHVVHSFVPRVGSALLTGMLSEMSTAGLSISVWLSIVHLVPAIARIIRICMNCILTGYEKLGQAADWGIDYTHGGAIIATKGLLDWLTRNRL